MSMNNGSCNIMNTPTGSEPNRIIGKEKHSHLPLKITNNVAPNATITETMARKRVPSPKINLLGSARRKSFSSKRAVKMERNINREVMDENNANTSDTTNTKNEFLSPKLGVPL